MILKLFWTVVALDLAGALFFLSFGKFSHGFEVFAFWVVLTAIVVTACVFLVLRSEGLRIAGFLVLLLPSTPFVFFTYASAASRIWDQMTALTVEDHFEGPALELAYAMRRHDLESMKQLLPAAGDLNKEHRKGMTLWEYGYAQAGDNEQSIEMLRMLTAAGADPRRDTSGSNLAGAIRSGPRLTRFLLEAGVDANVAGPDHRPVWWEIMEWGEDDNNVELLETMLDHGADLTWRDQYGYGPVGFAISKQDWRFACVLIAHGADWKQEKLVGETLPELLADVIIRKDEYPVPVDDRMRKVLADLTGQPAEKFSQPTKAPYEESIPNILREATFENLENTRARLVRLSQQPNWVRRVAAFFGDNMVPNHTALLLSLKPDALPEAVQERCWSALKEQVEWFDSNVASSPNQSNAGLLRETAVIAMGLASVPGPVRERHRADFTGLRDRIEKARKAKDPAAEMLPDLRKSDWRAE